MRVKNSYWFGRLWFQSWAPTRTCRASSQCKTYHWFLVIIYCAQMCVMRCLLIFVSYILMLEYHLECFRWPRSSLSSAVIEPSEFPALLMSRALWNANWLSLLLMVISTLFCLLLNTFWGNAHLLFMCSWWETPRCYRIATAWCIGWYVCVYRTTWCSFRRGSCELVPLGSYSTGMGSRKPLRLLSTYYL